MRIALGADHAGVDLKDRLRGWLTAQGHLPVTANATIGASVTHERVDRADSLVQYLAANGLYGVTKAADAGLGRALAVEWGPHNIRVNSIAPGLIKTDFARALWEDEERRKRREAMSPLRRLGDPVDIGGVAVFLASDAARFMTGQLLVIDGGVSVGW